MCSQGASPEILIWKWQIKYQSQIKKRREKNYNWISSHITKTQFQIGNEDLIAPLTLTSTAKHN